MCTGLLSLPTPTHQPWTTGECAAVAFCHCIQVLIGIFMLILMTHMLSQSMSTPRSCMTYKWGFQVLTVCCLACSNMDSLCRPIGIMHASSIL